MPAFHGEYPEDFQNRASSEEHFEDEDWADGDYVEEDEGDGDQPYGAAFRTSRSKGRKIPCLVKFRCESLTVFQLGKARKFRSRSIRQPSLDVDVPFLPEQLVLPKQLLSLQREDFSALAVGTFGINATSGQKIISKDASRKMGIQIERNGTVIPHILMQTSQHHGKKRGSESGALTRSSAAQGRSDRANGVARQGGLYARRWRRKIG